MIRTFYASLIAGVVLALMPSLAYAQHQDYYALFDIDETKREMTTETRAALIRGASPNMPRRAKRSGFCCLVMDVTKSGQPKNIKTSFCTEKVFRANSLAAAKHWRFKPAQVQNTPIDIEGQRQIMSYLLQDGRGRIIPDKNNAMFVNGKFDASFDRLCSAPDIS